MALGDMMAELRGSFPKIPFAYTKTLVNRAYKEVRESSLWSFQLFESSWITPPICTTGTVSVTQGLPNITFDATAIAAINASQLANTYSLITQRQFRIGDGGIYNIISYDSIGGGAVLDRMYADTPTGAGQVYQLYQLYYTPPMLDFRTFLSIRNPIMFRALRLTTTRAEIDKRDPQRLFYQFPTDAVPYGTDQRGAGTQTPSATLGYAMFELWGQPVAPFTYQCYGIRSGVDLVNPNDTLPQVVGEDLVLAKARAYAYEWAEANKDIAPRNTGPDFKFLIGNANAEYKRLLILYRKQDREFIDNWFSIRDSDYDIYSGGHYNTMAGVAGPG